MLIGLTRLEASFSEMLHYLEERYRGYQADFVINPSNAVLTHVLKGKNAVFDKEQHRVSKKLFDTLFDEGLLTQSFIDVLRK